MISPSKFRASAEGNVSQQIEHLASACMTMASGMAKLSATVAASAEETRKRLAALERVERGYSWPQIILLAGILGVLVWISLHLAH